MNLSKLVGLREHLKSVYNTDMIVAGLDRLDSELCGIKNDVTDIEFKGEISDLSSDLGRMYTALKLNRDRYEVLLEHVNNSISSVAGKFFNDNYELELAFDHNERLSGNRIIEITNEIREEILNRIRLYTNWQYPALEIGCNGNDWTPFLVAADPLYIVDHSSHVLDLATAGFTEEYKRRIRTYTFKDHDLSALPQGQFSFIFCWNYLNYCSLDTVKEYLKAVKDLLRPGGTFLFSYNDGDTEMGAGYAESYFMSYMPKSMLIPMCESIGLRVTYHNSGFANLAVSWIEVQKPGTLSTVKAHQVMGEIIYRNN